MCAVSAAWVVCGIACVCGFVSETIGIVVAAKRVPRDLIWEFLGLVCGVYMGLGVSEKISIPALDPSCFFGSASSSCAALSSPLALPESPAIVTFVTHVAFALLLSCPSCSPQSSCMFVFFGRSADAHDVRNVGSVGLLGVHVS